MAHSTDLIDAGDRLQWVGYISSTSVYGDHGSEWVDEDSELLAAHGKGLSRILAEGSWIALGYEYGIPVHIFRCGGIYGPRRSALDALQKEGRPSASQERRAKQKFTARCHVGDICKILEASTNRPRAGAVYNVVDDEPAGRGQVMEYAASLVAGRMASILHEMPMPPPLSLSSNTTNSSSGKKVARGLNSEASIDEIDTPVVGYNSNYSTSSGSSGSEGEMGVIEPQKQLEEASAVVPTTAAGGVEERETRVEVREHMPGVAATPNGEKRVKNELIKKELGVVLEFPTYREGLSAIAQGDMRPF